jgi:hypothetical protein
VNVPIRSLLGSTDLVRLVAWIGANGLAALVVVPLLTHLTPLLEIAFFGLILGLLQSAAVGRTFPEALAWTGLTVTGLTVVTMLVIFPLFAFGVVTLTVGELWIVAIVLSLPLGAGMGLAQGLVFAMRDVPPRTILIWVIVNAIAAAVVAAIGYAGPLGQGLLEDGVVAREVARTVYGITFGVLTAVPLTLILVETRAAEG